MIGNTTSMILVDGVSTANPVYKRNDSDAVITLPYVADGEGNALGAFAVTITDEIVGYIIKKIVLYDKSSYDISGIAIPGDTTVFISSGFQKDSIDALKNNIIASAYADEEGNFEFLNVSGSSGVISMWIATLAQNAPTASLTYERAIVYGPDGDNILTHSFMEPEGDCTHPRYTITGTCSEDIEKNNEKIYLSNTEDAMNISSLMETICHSVIPHDGTFTMEYTGSYEQNYVVWTLSKSGGYLLVNNISISNDTSTCLSGDTMITMADGSKCRMDTINVGDFVMSENGIPSCVYAIRSGKFSDYHTLYHFEDGTVIDETHPHRFYNVDQGFWQRLQLWKIGDHAINQNGDIVALTFVEHLDEAAEMFGIWTDSGTYYANGLLSGAASCNKKLLAEATAEQAIDMMMSTDEEWLVQLMGLEAVLP